MAADSQTNIIYIFFIGLLAILIQAFFVSMHEFNRIFNGNNMSFLGGINFMKHGGNGGGGFRDQITARCAGLCGFSSQGYLQPGAFETRPVYPAA